MAKIDFSVDKTKITTGDVVEVKWHCDSDDGSAELIINNGFRILSEKIGRKGSKKYQIYRTSNEKATFTLKTVLDEKIDERTLEIVVKNAEALENEDESTDKDIELIETTEFIEDEDSPGCFRYFVWLTATLLLTIPLFPFIYRFIPDLNWNGWDRIMEFVLLYLIVGVVLRVKWWLDIVILSVILTSLTLCTVHKQGYGFEQLAQDYKVFKNARQNREVITKYEYQDKKVNKQKKEIPQLEKKDLYVYFKEKIKAAVDYTNTSVRNFAANQVTNEPFNSVAKKQHSDEIRQIVHAFAVFKYINSNWEYVNDPRGYEYNSKASETILNMSNGKFTGDCDDHAILMAACVQAVGAKARIVCSRENGKGHAYPELYLGSRSNAETTYYLLNELFLNRDKKVFEYHIDENGDYWLNFDYTANYPGGEFLQHRDSIVAIVNI